MRSSFGDLCSDELRLEQDVIAVRSREIALPAVARHRQGAFALVHAQTTSSRPSFKLEGSPFDVAGDPIPGASEGRGSGDFCSCLSESGSALKSIGSL